MLSPKETSLSFGCLPNERKERTGGVFPSLLQELETSQTPQGFGKLQFPLRAAPGPWLMAQVLSGHGAGDAAQDQTHRAALPSPPNPREEAMKERAQGHTKHVPPHLGHIGEQEAFSSRGSLKVTAALICIHPAPAPSSPSLRLHGCN